MFRGWISYEISLAQRFPETTNFRGFARGAFPVNHSSDSFVGIPVGGGSAASTVAQPVASAPAPLEIGGCLDDSSTIRRTDAVSLGTPYEQPASMFLESTTKEYTGQQLSNLLVPREKCSLQQEAFFGWNSVKGWQLMMCGVQQTLISGWYPWYPAVGYGWSMTVLSDFSSFRLSDLCLLISD